MKRKPRRHGDRDTIAESNLEVVKERREGVNRQTRRHGDTDTTAESNLEVFK